MTGLFVFLGVIATIMASESRSIPSAMIACVMYALAGFFYLL